MLFRSSWIVFFYSNESIFSHFSHLVCLDSSRNWQGYCFEVYACLRLDLAIHFKGFPLSSLPCSVQFCSALRCSHFNSHIGNWKWRNSPLHFSICCVVPFSSSSLPPPPAFSVQSSKRCSARLFSSQLELLLLLFTQIYGQMKIIIIMRKRGTTVN